MATRPSLHKSDSDPCMTTTPTSVGNPAVTVEQTNTVSTTANANFAQIGQVPAALQLQNPIPTPMTAPVSSRSTGYANMNINPNLPDSRYFVSRVQNVGPLSKRRRTPQQQPQPTPGRNPLPNLQMPMHMGPPAPAVPTTTPGILRPGPSQVPFGTMSPSKSAGTPRTPKRKASEAIGPPVGTLTMPGSAAGGVPPGVGIGMGLGMRMGGGLPVSNRLGGVPGMMPPPASVGNLPGGLRAGGSLGAPLISPRVTVPINAGMGGVVPRPLGVGRPMMGTGMTMGAGGVPLAPNMGALGASAAMNLRVPPAPSLNSVKTEQPLPKGKHKATRRYRHNATERTRTRVISRKISELGTQMTNAGIKVKKEKLLILNSAVEYVSQLQASCLQHDTSNKQLEEQIAVMTQELEALQCRGVVPSPEPAVQETEEDKGAQPNVQIDYEKAFMSQPLPSLLMDHNFGIMSCNWLFLLFVNKTKEMVIGKTLLEILYPNPATKLKNWNTIKESFTKSHSVKLEDSAAVDGMTMRFQMIMSQSTCPGGKGQRIEAVFLPFLPARNPAHDNTLRPIRSWNELHFALV